MLSPGRPRPFGATVHEAGVNFAVYAPLASRVELCLFDGAGQVEQQRIPLPACTDGIWHGLLPQGRPGLVYGFRAHGAYAPERGLRHNPTKLLLDPYAREVLGRYEGGAIYHDRDRRDNAAVALKARVAPPPPPPPATRPVIARDRRVVCELHVRGYTQRHPGIEPALRGSFAGLAEPAVLDHLQRLGVTTLSLLPVQHHADEERLLGMGLVNYWGYNTIGWFAPDARLWSGREGTTPEGEFRALADAVHARGMELWIDVVYNHSAETDREGPCLSMRGLANDRYYRLFDDDRGGYVNWTGCGNTLDLREPRAVQLVMDSLRHWHGALGVDGFRFDLAPILGRSGGASGEAFDARAPLMTAISQDPQLAAASMVAEPWDIGPDGYCVGRFPTGWMEWNDHFRDAQRAFWLRSGPVDRAAFAHRFAASSGEFHARERAPQASVNFITAHDGFTLRDLVSYERRHNEANGEGNRDGTGHNLSRNCGVEGETDDPHVLAERLRRRRALLAMLAFSQGTPMLLGGDEIGHTQRGNNNAYCQDNEITWIDWERADHALAAYVARLFELRRTVPALRHAQWWPGEPGEEGNAALCWMAPDGHRMTPADWHRGPSALAIVFEPEAGMSERHLLLLNAEDHPIDFVLPKGHWRMLLASDADDPTAPAALPGPVAQAQRLGACCVWLARQEDAAG